MHPYFFSNAAAAPEVELNEDQVKEGIITADRLTDKQLEYLLWWVGSMIFHSGNYIQNGVFSEKDLNDIRSCHIKQVFQSPHAMTTPEFASNVIAYMRSVGEEKKRRKALGTWSMG
jgi:hypothetical protein